jgi:hypothetical protein
MWELETQATNTYMSILHSLCHLTRNSDPHHSLPTSNDAVAPEQEMIDYAESHFMAEVILILSDNAASISVARRLRDPAHLPEHAARALRDADHPRPLDLVVAAMTAATSPASAAPAASGTASDAPLPLARQPSRSLLSGIDLDAYDYWRLKYFVYCTTPSVTETVQRLLVLFGDRPEHSLPYSAPAQLARKVLRGIGTDIFTKPSGAASKHAADTARREWIALEDVDPLHPRVDFAWVANVPLLEKKLGLITHLTRLLPTLPPHMLAPCAAVVYPLLLVLCNSDIRDMRLRCLAALEKLNTVCLQQPPADVFAFNPDTLFPLQPRPRTLPLSPSLTPTTSRSPQLPRTSSAPQPLRKRPA